MRLIASLLIGTSEGREAFFPAPLSQAFATLRTLVQNSLIPGHFIVHIPSNLGVSYGRNDRSRCELCGAKNAEQTNEWVV